jgi:hypothetical protein
MSRRRRSQASSTDDIPPASSAWPKTDLLFLTYALKHGMSFAEVAGFLRRTEEQVREKAKELNIRPNPVNPYGTGHAGPR